AYNVYAEAVNKHGYVGAVYGLPRHLFRDPVDRWAEGRGVLVKAIEDVALGMASVYRQLELPLPERLPYADDRSLAAFADLVAKVMPFDLVIDEQTADGREARVGRDSVCGSWGPVAGTFPQDLAAAVRTALVEALLGGATPHPDQIRLRKAVDRLGFYWRRSGGRLAETAPAQTAARLAEQLQHVRSWDEFLNTR